MGLSKREHEPKLRRIFKLGLHSAVIVLPPKMLEKIDLKIGDVAEIVRKGNAIIVKKSV